MQPATLTIHAAKRTGWLAAEFKYHPGMVATFRALPNRQWNADDKRWEFEASEVAINAIQSTGARVVVQTDAVALWRARGGAVQEPPVENPNSITEALTFAKRSTAAIAELPAGFETRTAGRPHQLECLRHIAATPKFYLKMTVGTGKTWLFLNAARLAAHKLQRPVLALVVGPINKVPGYKHEIEKHIGADGHYVDARGDARRFARAMDAARAALRKFEHRRVNGVVYVCLNWDALAARCGALPGDTFDVYLEDESHLGKNPSSARAKAAMRLAENTRFVVRGSGTPAPSPLDLWAQLSPLRPGMLPSTFTAHKRRYAVTQLVDMNGGRKFLQVIGWQNMHELRDLFASVSYQATSNDIELDEPIFVRRYVTMAHEHRAVYEEVRRDGVVLLQAGRQMVANHAGTVLTRALQVCSGFVGLTDMEGKPIGQNQQIESDTKHAYIVNELLPQLYEEQPGRQVVLWSFHRHALQRLITMASALEIEAPGGKRRCRVAHLWGDTPKEQRHSIEEDFRERKYDLLISNPQSGGTALEFQTADVAIWESRNFNFILREQGIGRLWRLGQKKKVINIDVLYEDTLEDYVLEVNDSKDDVQRLLTNQPQRLLAGAFAPNKETGQ